MLRFKNEPINLKIELILLFRFEKGLNFVISLPEIQILFPMVPSFPLFELFL